MGQGQIREGGRNNGRDDKKGKKKGGMIGEEREDKE